MVSSWYNQLLWTTGVWPNNARQSDGLCWAKRSWIAFVSLQQCRPIPRISFPFEPCVNTFSARVDQGAWGEAVMLFKRAEYRHDFVCLEFVGLHDEIFALSYIVVAAAF